MSSLWTPGGEHPVGRSAGGSDRGRGAPDAGDEPGDATLEDLSPEERAEAEALAAEMAEVQRQLASTPAAVVVANHLMGFYELAAIHLSQERPNFAEAAVAIDAMAAVVEQLPGRLGENETVLRDALNQMRMAFVSLKNRADED